MLQGTKWQMNTRSINHFPTPRHSDQAHSKHGGMLPAWPMFSFRALELAGSGLHRSPLRQENGYEISHPLPLFSAGHTVTRQSLQVKLTPGKEATSGFCALVPGLYRVCLKGWLGCVSVPRRSLGLIPFSSLPLLCLMFLTNRPAHPPLPGRHLVGHHCSLPSASGLP